MKHLLRRFLLSSIVLCGIFSSTLASAETPRPEIAKDVKAYEGTEGVKVWTLRVGPRSAKEQIVQLEGTDHDWDMHIFKCKLEEHMQSSRCVIQDKGQRFVLLNMQSGSGELYLSGENSPRKIHYSEPLSRQGNAEHFLTDYLNQGKKTK